MVDLDAEHLCEFTNFMDEEQMDFQNAKSFLLKIQSIDMDNQEMKDRANSLLIASTTCTNILRFLEDVNAFNAWIYNEVGSGIGM